MTFLSAHFWATTFCFIVFGVSKGDNRVNMGRPSPFCDNGYSNIALDWDPASKDEYTCDGPTRNIKKGNSFQDFEILANDPDHICYNTSITYTEDLPVSGSHRPLWPVYGEYSFIPPQRWLHALEHGAIVLLYHPCAPAVEIEMFRELIQHCLRRYIFAAYKKLPPDMNFALLAWKWRLLLSSYDEPLAKDFIKDHALKGPERISSNGQYKAGLIKESQMVSLSDYNDSNLCPKLNFAKASQDYRAKSNARLSRNYVADENLKQLMAEFMDDFAE